MKTFGERIRELRARRKLSLREFAKRLGGISAAFLSDVELGRRYPSERVLASMARALGVEAEELRAYDTRPPVEDIRRLAESNPAYGPALRKVITSRVSPEDLVKLAEKNLTYKKRKR
ncbi:MAG: helix-turn-helix domain-containing protein [Acidobacteria bacterium]|nr:helix-turn-helix domain-containing protein [Acidobacteriota bacterium]